MSASHFYAEPIEVFYEKPPLLSKKPGCPGGFTWRAERYTITEMLAEWVDFERRRRMRRNMSDAHATTARLRGSWGVGRFFFRVRVEDGRVFDIYYDRAPGKFDERQGNWSLLAERSPEEYGAV
ncbi:MAG TPA: DUF6504 family protein [Levilinea sp.]|nr:DUF6504 family protein [Levilinea sp.]